MVTFLRRPETWLVVALVLGASVALLLNARGPTVRTVTPVRRDIEEHVVASGRVWVEARVQVSTQVAGLVVAVGAIEGQHVKAGELLVQLDDAEARASVAQAKAVVDQARARVEQLRRVGAIVTTEALKEALSTLERAKLDLERSEQLAASGAVAPAELENARHVLDLARAKKNAAGAGRVARRPISLGIRGDGSTEVVSGLDEQARVIVTDGQPLTPGMRVRALTEGQ